jgi:hypothetical protein
MVYIAVRRIQSYPQCLHCELENRSQTRFWYPLLVEKEQFSFAQNRPVLTDRKLTWLKVAGITEENAQCIQIREGLMDAEYRSTVMIGPMATDYKRCTPN